MYRYGTDLGKYLDFLEVFYSHSNISLFETVLQINVLQIKNGGFEWLAGYFSIFSVQALCIFQNKFCFACSNNKKDLQIPKHFS